MPGQRGTERRRMDQAALVRLPADLARRAADAADARELSLAAWLRMLAAEAIQVAPQEARPTRPRMAVPPTPPEIVREVAQLREVLAETHGTLRQVAGLKRRSGATGAELVELNALIDRLKADVGALDDLKIALMGGGRSM